jgi:hypothetical protein
VTEPTSNLPLSLVHLRRPDDFLDRDIPIEHFVARPPDSAHAAAADNGTKPVPVGKKSLRLARDHCQPLPSQGGT